MPWVPSIEAYAGASATYIFIVHASFNIAVQLPCGIY